MSVLHASGLRSEYRLAGADSAPGSGESLLSDASPLLSGGGFPEVQDAANSRHGLR
jgi:hypothetical protein